MFGTWKQYDQLGGKKCGGLYHCRAGASIFYGTIFVEWDRLYRRADTVSYKNSYLGQVDTAGFPKDSYYIYQAEWVSFQRKPVLHLFPYWDFNKDQTIDVRICSNASDVELFVNGVSKGRKQIDHLQGRKLTADYQVPYEEGEIAAVAYDETGKEVLRECRHSFGDSAEIIVRCVKADGTEYQYYKVKPVVEENRRNKSLYFATAKYMEIWTNRKELLFWKSV